MIYRFSFGAFPSCRLSFFLSLLEIDSCHFPNSIHGIPYTSTTPKQTSHIIHKHDPKNTKKNTQHTHTLHGSNSQQTSETLPSASAIGGAASFLNTTSRVTTGTPLLSSTRSETMRVDVITGTNSSAWRTLCCSAAQSCGIVRTGVCEGRFTGAV